MRRAGVTSGDGANGGRTLAVVLGLVGAKAVLHLALAHRYGFHGDELYFLECGRHLALGYVDHAPLVPWIARASEAIGGTSLLALRLPAIFAATGTMALTALLVREWGGGVRAQLVALLSCLFAPAYLRMGAMLNIPVVEVFLCTAAAYLVARALRRDGQRTWWLVGLVAGIGLLTKHTTLLWGASLAVGLLVTEHRRALARPAPWVGLVVAALLFLPNVVWQAQNGAPTLEFSAGLRRDVLHEQGRALFVLGQVLYFHPFVVPVWIAGIWFAFTEHGRAVRPFAVLFLVMAAVLLVLGGKPYYLASAYPAVLAAGGVALERRLSQRVWLWRALVGSIALTGVGLAALTLPLLPLRTVDAAMDRLFGWVVPPMALTHDMHGELGWDAHVETVERVVASLPPDERDGVTILTGSYSQAAALNVLRTRATPRAVSGHMTYHLWGPGTGRGSVVIAYGLPLRLLERSYGVVEERARIVAPDARPWDTDLPVYVCREPRVDLRRLWPELRRFHHGELILRPR
ncbi:MAG: glycosyltransferase family 39 protein [Deltaproteobacteria bacterium]|nr:glycosyltransferase family 39 protein [Deltaproteobacteria bacterium]